MRGQGPFAAQMQTMFDVARKKFGLTAKPKLSAEHFRVPCEANGQLRIV
jgi:hypothetical protein